jgi:hypothetical protein
MRRVGPLARLALASRALTGRRRASQADDIDHEAMEDDSTKLKSEVAVGKKQKARLRRAASRWRRRKPRHGRHCHSGVLGLAQQNVQAWR